MMASTAPHVVLDFTSQRWYEIIDCLCTAGFDIHTETSE
jgi:hypothetical protein